MPTSIDNQEHEIISPLENANAFSHYFSCVFSTHLCSTSPQVNEPFNFDCITENMVLRALYSLKAKCKTSPNGIPNILLEKCRFAIVEPLSIIFNNSLL